MLLYACDRCKAMITPDDLRQGEALCLEGGQMLCRACHKLDPTHPLAVLPPAPVEGVWFCAKCQRGLTFREFMKGQAREHQGRAFCREHLPEDGRSEAVKAWVRCDRCQAPISPNALRSGAARVVERVIVCLNCREQPGEAGNVARSAPEGDGAAPMIAASPTGVAQAPEPAKGGTLIPTSSASLMEAMRRRLWDAPLLPWWTVLAGVVVGAAIALGAMVAARIVV